MNQISHFASFQKLYRNSFNKKILIKNQPFLALQTNFWREVVLQKKPTHNVIPELYTILGF